MSARMGLGVALEKEDEDGWRKFLLEVFFFFYGGRCVNNDIQQKLHRKYIIAFGDNLFE